MARYQADPRFDAFTDIVPYSRDLPTRSVLSDFPVTAKGQAIQRTGSLSSPISDAIRKRVSQISGLLKPDPYPNSSVPEEQDRKLEELDRILQECRENIEIDIGRLLRCAVAMRQLKICEHLVKNHGADLKSRDISGKSPISYAISYFNNSLAMLQYLASEMSTETLRSELNQQDISGSTALHYATSWGEPEPVQFCFMRGSDPSIRDNDGKSIWDIGGSRLAGFQLIALLYTHLKPHLDLPLYFSGYLNLVDRVSKIVSLSNFDLIGEKDGQVPGIKQSQFQWMHVPCTSGPLIFAAACCVMLDYASDDKRYPPLSRLIYDSFESPSIIPGDPHLSYRAPSCLTKYVNTWQRDDSLQFASLVVSLQQSSHFMRLMRKFPCLVLQPIGLFRMSRENLRRQRQLADTGWEMAGKYFQIERTLDEAYYPSLAQHVLHIRNEQQVVTRECKQTASGADVSGDYRPILMVPQLWIWLARSWVISAYTPPGKHAGRAVGKEGSISRPYDSWDTCDLGVKTGPYTESPEHHIAQLLADQVRRFGDVQGAEKFLSPLDIFEIGVARVLTSVNKYVENNNLATDDSITEIKLMNDIADIRDELAMVVEILRQQDMVLDDFIAHIDRVNSKQEKLNMSNEQTEPVEVIEMLSEIANAKAQIKTYCERVNKIDRDAERVDKTVQDRLNVKRTFASIRDSRASMSDAKTSLLLAIAVVGFTVITILFTPLAFMTALFALDIDELAKHKVGEGDDAVYPSWYIFVTFLSAEIATIALTALIVWCCVRSKESLTTWVEGISHKIEDTNKTTAGKMTILATTVPEAQPTRTSAVDQNQNSSGSSRSSVLSQRRPRPANPADTEERGAARAPGDIQN